MERTLAKGFSVHTLDQLIIDVASAELASLKSREIATQDASDNIDVLTYLILEDPHGDLLSYALAHAQKNPYVNILVGSRTLEQAELAADTARKFDVWKQVFIAGRASWPLRLDNFLKASCERLSAMALKDGSPHPLAVLTHLPKANEALRYFAASTAIIDQRPTFAPFIVAGGNTKFMNRNQNAILSESYSKVYASRGKGKFRCLVATHARDGVAYEAPHQQIDLASVFEQYQPIISAMLTHDTNRRVRQKAHDYTRGFLHQAHGNSLTLYGMGGVFSGAKPDHGGVFLTTVAGAHLRYSRALDEDAVFTGVDLGSGNGIVTAVLTQLFPSARFIALDAEADAVVSTEMSLDSLTGPRHAGVLWDESARALEPNSVDAVFLNPPFHEGLGVDATLVQELLDAAHTILKSGGELYMVHNSHLRYRRDLDKRFDHSDELARNAKFTVLRAVKQ